MPYKIFAAPLQGFTDAPFCHFHAEVYGGADAYFTPFMRVEKGVVRQRDIRNITSPLCANHKVVPQVIFKDEAEFKLLEEAVLQNGYDCLDINLGCPFKPQVLHGRGSALLRRPELIEALLPLIGTGIAVSAKMRVGVTDVDEWKPAVEALNSLPLTHLTVHPRIAAQQYAGDLHIEAFERLLNESRHPVVFNGDLRSAADISSVLERYPELHGVMVGRGLLARPSLIAEWRDGREWSRGERLEALKRLHSGIYAHYSGCLCGDAQILAKIKPFWEYMEDEIGRKCWKAIKKASSLPKYEEAVQSVFR